MELLILCVCLYMSVNIGKYVLFLDKNEYIYPHFLGEQSRGSNPEKEHLSAAQSVFFLDCDYIHHLHLKLLTCEGALTVVQTFPD